MIVGGEMTPPTVAVTVTEPTEATAVTVPLASIEATAGSLEAHVAVAATTVPSAVRPTAVSGFDSPAVVNMTAAGVISTIETTALVDALGDDVGGVVGAVESHAPATRTRQSAATASLPFKPAIRASPFDSPTGRKYAAAGNTRIGSR
jgi:hypothetical protein